ncbi:MAG: SufE family protein [Flavobacteriaceae bacterium]|nr:SufE family protein [Flavobacteriaceae bacterium]
MNISQIQEELIDEFAMFDNWMDRYQYMIELGKSLPIINKKFKTDDFLIKGCQSKVWVQADIKDNKILFKADSDAIISKGIIAILIRVYSGHSADEIINANSEFIDKIGLKENLSPNRANGLSSMIKQLKLYALAFKTKQNNE